jgi:hypothetical protein
MYELIKMREGLRHLCLSVGELREVLCCEHTYERFSDFRRHVLDRARTEIKETCDAYYTYLVERDGRTPVRVRFLIHRHEEDEAPPPVRREEESPSRNWSRTTGGESRQFLQEAEDRYNLYVSILSRLPQGTLSDLNRSAVQSALQHGKRAATPPAPDASPATVAEQVVRRAVTTLQEG